MVLFSYCWELSTEELMLLNCGVGENSRVPWTARRSNQSILKEMSPGCSLEGLMLKLKLQYFGHMMRIADSLEKTLFLGMIEGRRRRGRQRIRWLMASLTQWWVWVDSGSWWWTEKPGVLSDMTEWLNWTELNGFIAFLRVERWKKWVHKNFPRNYLTGQFCQFSQSAKCLILIFPLNSF